MSELDHLKDVVRQLRDPEHGCPWDSVQTFMSLRRYLVEEAGEYLDAVEDGNIAAMKDELGDVLLQVVLHSQIASEQGLFDFEDVAQAEASKMVRRHPHVFGDVVARDEATLRANWERIKGAEATSSARKSAVDGIARSMPALARADKFALKAARVGFEWPTPEDAWKKVREELAEVEQAAEKGDDAALQEEMGDLLLAIAVYGRKKGIYTEEALQAALAKALKRFHRMEETLDVHNATHDELLAAWKAAKETD